MADALQPQQQPLVVSPAVIAPQIVAPEQMQVGDNVFVSIVLTGKKGAKTRVRRFSQREIRWMDKLRQTRSLEIAGLEVGITADMGLQWLKKPHVREYMHQQERIAALSNGTDVKEHVAWLRQVRDGEIVPTGLALEASKQLSRFLKPSAPAVLNVNQTNIQNNAAAAPSPYKGLSIDELAVQMMQRVAVIQGRPKP